jgi:hypothetical protein
MCDIAIIHVSVLCDKKMSMLHFGDIATHVSVLCVKKMSKLHVGDIVIHESVLPDKKCQSYMLVI